MFFLWVTDKPHPIPQFFAISVIDSFGDYVSDQVVAPVRETCAQALGAVLKYMHPTLVHETLNILLQMQVTMSQAQPFVVQ